jgi:hypothetical protein
MDPRKVVMHVVQRDGVNVVLELFSRSSKRVHTAELFEIPVGLQQFPFTIVLPLLNDSWRHAALLFL